MSRSLLQSGLALIGLLLAGCASAQGSSSAAASVNGHDVSASAYNTQVAYMRATSGQSTGIDVCQVKGFAPLCHKLKQTALQNVINEELVRQYAATHHVSVSPSDFNRQWAQVFQNKFASNPAYLRDWAKSVGITASDIKDMVRQGMLQQAVMYSVTVHMPTSAPAVRFAKLVAWPKSQLQSVESALKAGESFAAIGGRLSLDPKSPCKKESCGEIGWVPDALLPAGYQQMVTDRDGTTIGPSPSQNGYILLLVEGHTNNLPLTASQELSMRQQLFNRWLAQQAQRATIHRYAAT